MTRILEYNDGLTAYARKNCEKPEFTLYSNSPSSPEFVWCGPEYFFCLLRSCVHTQCPIKNVTFSSGPRQESDIFYGTLCRTQAMTCMKAISHSPPLNIAFSIYLSQICQKSRSAHMSRNLEKVKSVVKFEFKERGRY